MLHAGSVAASEIFKPGELTEGEKIEVIVLQYRAEGPQMSPINAQLKQAFSQTFTVGLLSRNHCHKNCGSLREAHRCHPQTVHTFIIAEGRST